MIVFFIVALFGAYADDSILADVTTDANSVLEEHEMETELTQEEFDESPEDVTPPEGFDASKVELVEQEEEVDDGDDTDLAVHETVLSQEELDESEDVDDEDEPLYVPENNTALTEEEINEASDDDALPDVPPTQEI